MKKLLILALLVLPAAFLVGCEDEDAMSAGSQELQDPARTGSLDASLTRGVLDDTGERQDRLHYINTLQGRMLVDDWDALWLYDRSTRLTPFVAHVGR
jgi:hypothetical protein